MVATRSDDVCACTLPIARRRFRRHRCDPSVVLEGGVDPKFGDRGIDLSSPGAQISRIALAHLSRSKAHFFFGGSDTVPRGLRTAVLVVT